MHQRHSAFRFHANGTKDHAAGLRRLFARQGDQLVNAAGLLAGRQGEKIAQEIHGRLGSEQTPSRQTRELLNDLFGILALENVDMPDSEEAARFAAIHPNDPVVEEICLVTDALRSALDELDKTKCGQPTSVAA